MDTEPTPPHAACTVPIAELGVIGDRRSAALVDRSGRIVWYCPGRFDEPALFAGLIDPQGGAWVFEARGAQPLGRAYVGGSAVLETRFAAGDATLTLTDFMPVGGDVPAGILCRIVSPAAVAQHFTLTPRPDYAAGRVPLRLRDGVVLIGADHRLHGSHPTTCDHEAGSVGMAVPPGEAGFMVMASRDLVRPNLAEVQRWRASTLRAWDDINGPERYQGAFADAVRNSLRALRLLTFGETGGVVAAVTTSLPEVVGGERNYDYRYVWLRDAGMVASALARAGTDSEGPRFLDFLSSTHGDLQGGDQPLAPLVAVAGGPAPPERLLTLGGWRDSRPVRIGNSAKAQLQLDGYANLLFAAQAVFDRTGRIPQWPVIEAAAEFLAAHWRDPEAGIWEEDTPLQHTASKAITACGLSYMAQYAPDPERAERWRRAVSDIKRYVAGNCMTPDGAYASVAGSDTVDIANALLSFWQFAEPDDPALARTMALLDRDYSHGGILYRRHLETAGDPAEGIFLAGTLWAAKHWIARGDAARGRAIIEAVLGYANDLGFLSEEIDLASGAMLGNFPQSFVHAALIGAILDLDRL